MPLTYGADLSHWDGNIDWSIIQAEGVVKFAILKASEGTAYKDTQFENYKRGCQDIGLPWGAYHYFRPGGDPVMQARNFKNCVGSGCNVYVIDVEESGTSLSDKIQAFLNELHVPTKMIYTSPAFWNGNIGNQAWAAEYPLWIANYQVSTPWIPKPWTTYKIWQYSCTGTVNGIPAAVDENYFNGDENNMRVYFGNGANVPPPQPVTRVKVNVGSLNIRSAPVVATYTQLGYTSMGKVWEVEDTVLDSQGRKWYKVGKSAFLAGWYCVPV